MCANVSNMSQAEKEGEEQQWEFDFTWSYKS